MAQILTPERVEQRLMGLSSMMDTAQESLEKCEIEYANAKSIYEIAMAESRIRLGSGESKLRVQEIEDHALVLCQEKYFDLNLKEAMVKSARSNIQRVRTQVDIARSLGTSVRSAMEL